MINRIVECIRENDKLKEKPVIHNIAPFHGYKGIESLPHHFFLFLKPEVLSIRDSVNIDAVISLFLNHCDEWGVNIGGIKVFSGKAIRNNRLIERNYETLFSISNGGLTACSDSVRKNITTEFPNLHTSSCSILGGHQFLRKFTNLTAGVLNQLIDTKATKKVGSGAYAVKIHYSGNDYLLINAFHPYQIETLSPMGGVIIALECFSEHPWTVLRNQFIGTVVPENASSQSFRRKLFEGKRHLNLKNVDISNNGIHISPGPLEAAFQFKTFFSETEHTFIEALLKKIYPSSFIDFLFKNPHLKSSSAAAEKTLFEQTEDMCASTVIQYLDNYYSTLGARSV